jgi:GntR family transcriptional regulator, transcriptional repressor for pyruvate dehydrogenase complex
MKLPALEPRVRLPARVAELISAEIRSGRLKPGARLPTEQELSARLGVSRNVVREAIARLRSDGIVESRQGVGAFLLRTESWTSLRFDAKALEDLAEFQLFFELRAMIEIDAAGLAAQRRQPKAMKDLKAALERMRGSEKWEQGGVDADLDFHRAVALTTGNHYIVKVASFIAQQMRESIAKTRHGTESIAEMMDVTIAEHQAIYEAIRSGSPSAARKAMSRHISNAAARLGVSVDHGS